MKLNIDWLLYQLEIKIVKSVAFDTLCLFF